MGAQLYSRCALTHTYFVFCWRELGTYIGQVLHEIRVGHEALGYGPIAGMEVPKLNHYLKACI